MKRLMLAPLFLLTMARECRGADSRDVDFARRTHDTKIVAEMPELLEPWTVPQAYGSDQSQSSQRQGITAVNAIFTIVWTDKAARQRQLGEIVEAQRQKLRGAVETLRERGLLTEDEAAKVTARLIVTVPCEIEPRPLT